MNRPSVLEVKKYAFEKLLEGRRLDASGLAQMYGCRWEKARSALFSLLREGRAQLAVGGGFVLDKDLEVKHDRNRN